MAKYPRGAGWKDREISKANADDMDVSGRTSTLRSMVLALYQSGFVGTADDAAEKIGESILAIRPRCTELSALGELKRTGEKRLSHGGRMAAVLTLNAAQRELFNV